MRDLLVIFSGYNQRAIIAFLRCLRMYDIEDYVIVAASGSDTILLTDYAKKVFAVRENIGLDLNELTDILKRIRNHYGVQNMVIPPSTEALDRFVLKNREKFEKIGCIIPLVNEKLYTELSDKETFYDLCRREGMAVPESMELPDSFRKEFVAKPKVYMGSDNIAHAPRLIMNEADFKSFCSECIKTDYTCQEFIRGYSYYLFYYIFKDGRVVRFSQINYLQQPEGKSMVAAGVSDIHKEPIADAYERLLKKYGYYGFAMVEVRKRGDDYYMIEINPRFWGPSQLLVDAHCGLFEGFLREYGFLLDNQAKAAPNKEAKYFWSDGFEGDIHELNGFYWHEGGREAVLNDLEAFEDYDLLSREDTLRISKRSLK